MRKSLMMRRKRRFMTELSSQKSPGGASRKRKYVHQDDQNSQDRVTLHRSDSESDLSENSTCQRKDSDQVTHTSISLHLSKKTLVNL